MYISVFWLTVIYYNTLLGLGFWYLRVFGYTVIYIAILILIFQREVLYKYYYCHVVFVIFEKFFF